MIARINELKTITKNIWKCKCKFYGRKCHSNQKQNVLKCWYKCKMQENIMYA